MGQTKIDSIGRLRPLTLRKSFYALEVLPTYAKVGGAAWADDFARLSVHEQRAIVWRMVAQAARAKARRAGRPDPIFFEAEYKPLPGGGYALDQSTPMVPLRPEYGGDGRTMEDAVREAKVPTAKDNLALWYAAEKIKAKLAEAGITVIYENDPVTTLRAIVPKPRRTA